MSARAMVGAMDCVGMTEEEKRELAEAACPVTECGEGGLWGQVSKAGRRYRRI